MTGDPRVREVTSPHPRQGAAPRVSPGRAQAPGRPPRRAGSDRVSASIPRVQRPVPAVRQASPRPRGLGGPREALTLCPRRMQTPVYPKPGWSTMTREPGPRLTGHVATILSFCISTDETQTKRTSPGGSTSPTG